MHAVVVQKGWKSGRFTATQGELYDKQKYDRFFEECHGYGVFAGWGVFRMFDIIVDTRCVCGSDCACKRYNVGWVACE